MANFLLQSDSDSLDTEIHMIQKLLNKNHYVHDYNNVTMKRMLLKATKDDIPVGSILFVTKFLNHFYRIEKMNPIEVPEYLRTEEFLKRDYKFIKAKDLPRSGNYFIKDVSTLKNFTYCGMLEYIRIDDLLVPPKKKNNKSVCIDPNADFLLSSVCNVESEYRIYVIDGKIDAICNYNGDSTLFPDISLIKKAVAMINYNEKYLKSYTLDIMVGKFGTAIIEVHNFCSVGLYSSLWGSNLLHAYIQGLDYLINDNKKLVEDI